ncbi:MAG: bifunctional riboflavin kinase/FAD synthetase [Bacteroidetes bacterium]|nr:bifunctional riboflavin kinase/FAD synthetase [Bacteroidota bacterium]
MKIYRNIDEFRPLKNAVVTIGTFDGVHLGHRKIISRINELAKDTGGESVILTFFPHPRMIIHPEDQDMKMINTMDEKAALLEQLGVDHLIITPFTRDFSNQSPEEYIKQVLIDKIGTKTIVIGYDHRFGKDRKGSLADLQQLAPAYGYEVIEIPEQDIHDVAVSSTRIRTALLNDQIELANEFLGYPFFITGKVNRGDQIGRTIGYPTANILIGETYKLVPPDGIYAVKVHLGNESFKGMGYIGHRPTINGMTRNIEVNILDFNRDIYSQPIKMELLHFVRGDMKFDSLDQLKAQIDKDKTAVKKFFDKQ